MKAAKLTFIKLLEKFKKIEIPIIQRNYAQGRKNEANIRNSFLVDIKNVLKNDKKENKSLCLDFIYGVNDREVFIPIDGQQRLTTLFLLYWYYLGEDSDIKNRLEKFTYETRESSKQFCNNLVRKFKKSNEKEPISKQIKNQNWYYSQWNQDPTINSMLNMLDAIENILGNNEQENKIIKDNLRSDSLYFYFIETKEFGEAEDLYIKMNSRGKELTTFEKFKSKLEKYIKNEFSNIPNFYENFSDKIDNNWINYFLRHIEKDKKNINDILVIDDWLMNLCITIFENYYVVNNDMKDNTKKYIKKFDEFPKDNKMLSFEECLEERAINIETIKTIYYILEYFYDLEEYEDDEYKIFVSKNDLLKNIIKKNTVQKCYKIQMYAICKYIVKMENKLEKENKKEISQILYIVRNLTENLYIDDDEKYSKLIKLIDRIISKVDSNKSIFKVVSELDLNIEKSNIGNKDIEDLLEQEYRKSKYLLKNDEWKKEILKIDALSYFSGNTGFLFDFIEENDNLENYRYYSRMIKAIFQNIENNEDITDFEVTNENNKDNIDPILNNEKFYFKRALLIFGNYMYKVSTRYSLLKCNDGDKYHSWKKLFTNNKYDNEKKCVKKLLDELRDKYNSNSDIKEIEYNIKKIVDAEVEAMEKNENDKYKNERWRMYFIKYPELINEVKSLCDGNLPYIYINDNEIYLMRGRQTHSYNWEFYTYALKFVLMEKCLGVNFEYNPTTGKRNDKYLIYKEKNIKLRYNNQNNKYEIIDNKENIYQYDTEKDIVNAFEKIIK